MWAFEETTHIWSNFRKDGQLNDNWVCVCVWVSVVIYVLLFVIVTQHCRNCTSHLATSGKNATWKWPCKDFSAVSYWWRLVWPFRPNSTENHWIGEWRLFFCASLMVCNSWKNSRPCLCYGLSGLETVLGCMLEAQLLCNFVLNFLFICV